MNDKTVLVDSCYEMQSPGPLLIFYAHNSLHFSGHGDEKGSA